MSERMYAFDWKFIGDVALGRPNLGSMAPVEVYRLFQYTLRDVLEQEYGTEQADKLICRAGYIAGKHFYEKHIMPCESFTDFVSKTQDALFKKNIGILRIEDANIETLELTLTVSEDLDCSGLPEMAHGVCTYDEGFISGILESFTGKSFSVKEIDCWCTGDRVCRFSVAPSLP